MNASIKTAIAHWPRVAPVLTPPRTKADFQQLVEALDAVLDAGGADEKHPLARLADYLGDLIADYEAAHRPKKEMPVPHLLRELMAQQSLRQADLPEVGPQSVVSEVLRGKRQLNVRQIAKLAKRFKLPAEVFMG
jgi:HTH-type transcriptional regulator / antitoxin HigA